jgi:hypothetical protein
MLILQFWVAWMIVVTASPQVFPHSFYISMESKPSGFSAIDDIQEIKATLHCCPIQNFARIVLQELLPELLNDLMVQLGCERFTPGSR